MRETIERCLSQKQLDYFSLPLSARLLLVTDGTVTELLEALLKETITIGYKNSEKISIANNDSQQRRITLQGEQSQQHWLYAESIVHVKNFSVHALELLAGNEPIGKILSQVYPDNHRIITDCGLVKNSDVAHYLGENEDYLFTYRCYDIITDCNVLINIIEWFPIDKIEQQIQHCKQHQK